ncbi:MAG: hypothetical protein N4A49_15385 [Marinifilaceae bacterium]|jgi:hypothetical protein|nr:hypothetical protein [Marinifilaceae bacterium]
MKQIGGEIEQQALDFDVYFTDTGRSSLRLLLRSQKINHVQIPQFLCPIIIDILVQEGVKYTFYSLDKNLQIEESSLNFKSDALYIINYFGVRHKQISKKYLESKIVIEDSVFNIEIENSQNAEKWFGYNSFRKVSNCVEGSIIKTNLDINQTLIENKFADFIENRYMAKNYKYRFIKSRGVEENVYLNLANKSEKILDSQNLIYSISQKGLYFINQLYSKSEFEKCCKLDNYIILEKKLIPILNSSKDANFFVFKDSNPQGLKSYLRKFNIFLPGFWPNSYEIENNFYDELVAIPIDSRYSVEDMNFILDKIIDFRNYE